MKSTCWDTRATDSIIRNGQKDIEASIFHEIIVIALFTCLCLKDNLGLCLIKLSYPGDDWKLFCGPAHTR